MTLSLPIPRQLLQKARDLFLQHETIFWILFFSALSIGSFVVFTNLNLVLAYNDARSHLDIGRRVVEGLKPGLAQLGSVWLPLPHILMIPTVWNDFMWHSGLSGSIQSMIAYVGTILLIRAFLKQLGVGTIGQVVGMLVFALNVNIIYLQSTAMTELLLIGVLTAACYQFLIFFKTENILDLLKSSFWIMLGTLVRYDGWFLFAYCTALVVLYAWKKKGYVMSEGIFVIFCTLAGFGIFLWILWNAVIFKDPLYFAYGQYSAHAQQDQLADAGVLITKKNLSLSTQTYWYAMAYNTGTIVLVIGLLAAIVLLADKKIPLQTRVATTALFSPLIFNVLALYLGHSVLFVQGINGDTWFNVRYGIMMMPSIAIFIGYLVWKWVPMRTFLIVLVFSMAFIQIARVDAVTIDDGRVGSSQKNVSEVSGWLRTNAKNTPGFVLISAASHDAIIFSSDLPMSKFIHEGTGTYWTSATTSPDRWARWIVMRTNDENDQTFKLVKKSGALWKYTLVDSYPFADIYQLKDEYLDILQTKPVLPVQR